MLVGAHRVPLNFHSCMCAVRKISVISHLIHRISSSLVRSTGLDLIQVRVDIWQEKLVFTVSVSSDRSSIQTVNITTIAKLCEISCFRRDVVELFYYRKFRSPNKYLILVDTLLEMSVTTHFWRL
jgi:hypothetical protein